MISSRPFPPGPLNLMIDYQDSGRQASSYVCFPSSLRIAYVRGRVETPLAIGG
jgi:hypothetical protein